MYEKSSLPTELLDLRSDVVPLKFAEDEQKHVARLSELSQFQFEPIENGTFAMN